MHTLSDMSTPFPYKTALVTRTMIRWLRRMALMCASNPCTDIGRVGPHPDDAPYPHMRGRGRTRYDHGLLVSSQAGSETRPSMTQLSFAPGGLI